MALVDGNNSMHTVHFEFTTIVTAEQLSDRVELHCHDRPHVSTKSECLQLSYLSYVWKQELAQCRVL